MRFRFNLLTIFIVTTAFAVLFAVFRWANLPVGVCLLVTAIVLVGFIAGFVLIASVASTIDDSTETPLRDGEGEPRRGGEGGKGRGVDT